MGPRMGRRREIKNDTLAKAANKAREGATRKDGVADNAKARLARSQEDLVALQARIEVEVRDLELRTAAYAAADAAALKHRLELEERHSHWSWP